MPDSSDLLRRLRDNYQLACAHTPPEHKSSHWDVFPEDYVRAFDADEAWPKLLRNALSHGLNDDFAAFVESGNKGPDEEGTPYRLRHAHDYRDLLPAVLTDARQIETIRRVLGSVVQICGAGFVVDHLAPLAGDPACARFDLTVPGREVQPDVAINAHDLSLIYYFWQILRTTRAALGQRPVIAEIGGGFGGLAAKLKDAYPDALCLLFDLPEVTAVQHYYLRSRFPEARIVDMTLWMEEGHAALDQADFAVLPGWLMTEFAEGSVDLAINVRSMMEMTPVAIAFYLEQVQRVVRESGVFACVNRYAKGDPPIKLKDYPFDGRWRLLLSQASAVQPHIHELVAERTAEAQAFTVHDALQSLPPF